MLLVRGQAGDRQRALTFLDESLAAAEEMGMAYLIQKIIALQEQVELA